MDVQFFPNPSSGSITLTNPKEEDFILRVYDNKGVIVHQQKINKQKEVLSLTLSSGVYTLSFETASKIAQEKWVVLNNN